MSSSSILPPSPFSGFFAAGDALSPGLPSPVAISMRVAQGPWRRTTRDRTPSSATHSGTLHDSLQPGAK
jgi:hypothetical protein